MLPRQCSEQECERKHYAKDLCKYHYSKERREADRQRANDYAKKYRDADPERWRAIARKSSYKLYHSDPEYRKRRIQSSTEHNHTRRAKLRSVESEKFTVKDVVDTYGWLCHICKIEINKDAPRKIGLPGWQQGLHIEHVVSLALGGVNTLANVRPAHGFCNLSKGRG